eukprot:500149_1
MQPYHVDIQNGNSNCQLTGVTPICNQAIITTTPILNNLNHISITNSNNLQKCNCIVCINSVGGNTLNICMVDAILNNMNNLLSTYTNYTWTIPHTINTNNNNNNTVTPILPLPNTNHASVHTQNTENLNNNMQYTNILSTLSNQIIASNNLSLSNTYSNTSSSTVSSDNTNNETSYNTTSLINKRKLSNRGRKKIDRSEHLNNAGRYQCRLCPKSYKRYNDLKGHFVIHKDDTKCCPHCKKKFSRPIYLRDHIRTHTGEKPFECNICRKGFCAKRNLTAHKKRHFRPNSRV